MVVQRKLVRQLSLAVVALGLVAGAWLALAGSVGAEDETPVPGSPAAPSELWVTNGDGAVTLEWELATADSSILKWQFQEQVGDEDWGWWLNIPGSNADTRSYTVSNLTNGTEYFYRVRAVNGVGNGAASWGVPGNPGPVPAKPSHFTATGNGDNEGSVDLAWFHGFDSSITRWEARYREGDGPYNNWLSIPNNNPGTRSVHLAGLTVNRSTPSRCGR